ncbi:transposase [Pseudomonas sp. SWRI153]|uniref:Transposase n=1 Tax=Pseudomonas khorasanensis TaxID=2745508 RepID=A0A923JGT9_9PSED|nr:transposase [Pseudomonas khorasanensis]MBV4487852.1 transposase [Pseudomonas khorasanensis]
MPAAANVCRLRKGRYSEKGRIYLLTAVVNRRERVFNNWHDGRLVVNELRRCSEAGLVASLAYVVMPDHLHWLVELQEGSLADLMCRVKSRSCQAYNQKHGRQGQLWQRGYYDRALRRDEDLKDAALYVVKNPVRAGLVERTGDYPLWDATWL